MRGKTPSAHALGRLVANGPRSAIVARDANGEKEVEREDDDEKDFGRDEQGVVDQKIRVGVEGSAPVVFEQQQVPRQVSDQEALED